MEPKARLDLQLANREAVTDVPIGVVQTAIESFYVRRKLRVAQKGKTSKHIMKSKLDLAIPRRENGQQNPETNANEIPFPGI